MKRLKQILRSKYLFKILVLLAISYSLIMTFLLPIKSKYHKDIKEIVGMVIGYEVDGNRLKVTLKGKEKIIGYYYFKSENEMQRLLNNIELGVILKLNGSLEIPKKNTIPNGFDYQKYLKYHGINYYMNSSKITFVNSNKSVFYYIKNKIIKRIDKIDDTGYLRTFILGDKSLIDDDIIEGYQNNGISHLFSISGMHVSLIVGVIMFVLNKISYSNYYKNGIVIFVLLFYLFLTGVSASILRTVIMFIVFAFNKTFNLKIKRLDLMLFVLTISIIINPFILFDIGFQFSYIISFTLIIFYKKISTINGKIKNSILISLICFCISFPICIYNYSVVNILSILLNIIIVPIVSLIVFPLTLITFVFPYIFPLYKIVIDVFEYLNLFFCNITFFELVLFKPPIIVIILYYMIIYLSIWNFKYFIYFNDYTS